MYLHTYIYIYTIIFEDLVYIWYVLCVCDLQQSVRISWDSRPRRDRPKRPSYATMAKTQKTILLPLVHWNHTLTCVFFSIWFLCFWMFLIWFLYGVYGICFSSTTKNWWKKSVHWRRTNQNMVLQFRFLRFCCITSMRWPKKSMSLEMIHRNHGSDHV